MTEAVAWCRARKGPALVHAKVHPAVLALAVRRRAAVQDAGGARGRSEARSDHEVRGAAQGAGLATDADLAAIAKDVDREIAEAADAAIKAPKPGKDTAGLYVYSPDVDPTSARVRHAGRARGQARHDGRGHQPHDEGRDGARTRASSSSARTSRTRRTSRTSSEVQGKGGVFKVTHGLQKRVRRRTACSTRRSPRPTSSAAPSAWRRAASSRSSRSSSSTTSGRR